MIVLEMKAVVKPSQCSAIDEAIRTVQFIRNKALRLWMDAIPWDMGKLVALFKGSCKTS